MATFTPSQRVFTHTDGLDHRLFDEHEHLFPEVRRYILSTLGAFWMKLYGYRWDEWSKVYFAGSEASEWTSPTLEGNNDFDVLVGINYGRMRKLVPSVKEMTNEEIQAQVNDQFKRLNNPNTYIMVNDMRVGPLDNTWYNNLDSYDITRIKPYAAYNVSDDKWTVKPAHLPHWSLDSLPKADIATLRAADKYARSVLRLSEPQRTQQGAALFQAWHSDRSRAFSDKGEGWYDLANLREKWLDQAGVWKELVECAHRAKLGLDAAPADWSNTPPEYKTAALPPQEDMDKIKEYGQSEHPNVDQYRSGGLGHIEGDESRSVVGFMPTKTVAKYRDHNGDQHHNSRKVIDGIREDIRNDKGITNPLVVHYDHKNRWGFLGEGNHRLKAAEEEGLKTVPVRVVRGAGGRDFGHAKSTGRVGAPMEMQSKFGDNPHDPDYVPTDIHPYHFLK
jgi:hypothetical protein